MIILYTVIFLFCSTLLTYHVSTKVQSSQRSLGWDKWKRNRKVFMEMPTLEWVLEGGGWKPKEKKQLLANKGRTDAAEVEVHSSLCSVLIKGAWL